MPTYRVRCSAEIQRLGPTATRPVRVDRGTDAERVLHVGSAWQAFDEGPAGLAKDPHILVEELPDKLEPDPPPAETPDPPAEKQGVVDPPPDPAGTPDPPTVEESSGPPPADSPTAEKAPEAPKKRAARRKAAS